MFQKQKLKRCFTLVEILIVIVIIGILAAALIPKIRDTQSRARDVARKHDLRTVYNGLEIYKSDRGGYPYATSIMAASAWYSANGVFSWHTWSAAGGSIAVWPNHIYVKVWGESPFWIVWLKEILSTMPLDPINYVPANGYSVLYNGPRLSQNYSYGYQGKSATSFNLVTKLENRQDPDRCQLKQYKNTAATLRCGVTTNVDLNQLYELSPDDE